MGDLPFKQSSAHFPSISGKNPVAGGVGCLLGAQIVDVHTFAHFSPNDYLFREANGVVQTRTFVLITMFRQNSGERWLRVATCRCDSLVAFYCVRGILYISLRTETVVMVFGII